MVSPQAPTSIVGASLGPTFREKIWHFGLNLRELEKNGYRAETGIIRIGNRAVRFGTYGVGSGSDEGRAFEGAKRNRRPSFEVVGEESRGGEEP